MKIKIFILFVLLSFAAQSQFSAARKLLLAQTGIIVVDDCYWNTSYIVYDEGVEVGYLDDSGYQVSLRFNADYSKFYYLSQDKQKIYQFNLSTNKEVSTASLTDSLDISGVVSIPMGLDFNSNGDKLYILDFSSDRINQYSLSNVNSISSATYESKYFNVGSQITNPINFCLNDDFTKVYVFGFTTTDNYYIAQYSIGDESDITTATYDSKIIQLTDISGAVSTDISVSNNSTKVYVSRQGIYEYSMSTKDISTLSLDRITTTGDGDYYSFHTAGENYAYSIYLTGHSFEVAQFYFDCDETPPISNLTCPSPLILDSASVGTFQMAHALINDGTYIYAGERIANTTPDSIARIIKYNTSLVEVDAYEVGPNKDVESMVYDNTNSRIYASQIYDNGSSNVVSIMRINPSNMTLVDTTVYNSLITGQSFPLVTDGTYIYGGTYAGTPEFFKIRISDMALVATNTWTNGQRAHAARIDVENGYMYVTDIPYAESSDVRFAKVSLSDLSYSEVNIGAYVRKATDDFAMIDTGTEVYCYIGSEYVYSSGGNSGYGGVRVKTSDLSLTGMSLKTTYAVAEVGDYIYSTTIDGNIQIFNRNNLSDVVTCDLGGYFGNEITSFGNRVFMTNFESYDKTKGKLIEIDLIE